MLGLIAICAAIVLVFNPLVRALARRLDRPARASDTDAEIGDLQMRVADLEASQQRMLELEERLDFAERMLAQRTALELPEHRTPA